MSQDLHLKASGFLAEGWSFLANMYIYCTLQKSTAKSYGKLSEKYKSQENGKEKAEVRTNVCPTVYCLV